MRFSKGQQEALSAVLISGILIGVVGSVYFWGIPLVQKNKDISLLETSESFMRQLDDKIKSVANTGGRDQLVVNVPGVLKFDGSMLDLSIETEGTIYATDAQIPLGRGVTSNLKTDISANPPVQYGVWGTDDTVLFNVISNKISQNKYKNDYKLEYVQLRNQATLRDFQIVLTGQPTAGGLQRTIVIESAGDAQTLVNGRTLISSNVKISIV